MTRAMNDIRKGIPYIPSDPGFYREDGPVDWLRTQEGVWLHSTFPFNTRWTLDVNCMPAVDMAHLRPVTPAEAAALNDVTEVEGIDPLDTYDGIAGTFGE